MQATARLKYLMMSPRKLRRVVSLVKGKSVEEALTILKFTNKAAASPLAKTIQSATANALSIEGTSKIKAEDLSIAQINIDEGPRAKRIMFRAMGRAYRFKKRFAHITVVVEGEPQEEVVEKKSAKTKAADVEPKAGKPAKGKGKKAKAAKAAAPDVKAEETAAEPADVETKDEEPTAEVSADDAAEKKEE
ncbi:MAG: 50S ribosomal protein L22 [Candidatus Zixiibacteriota bacterium]